MLGHIVSHHIWKDLEDHSVLSNFQHGFLKRRNCETQFIMVIHDLVMQDHCHCLMYSLNSIYLLDTIA